MTMDTSSLMRMRVYPAVDDLGTSAHPLNSTSTAYEASRLAKASAGVLYGFSGFNSKATSQFIQVHDAAALPAEAEVPVITFQVVGSSPFSMDFGQSGRKFANGIVICNSSTGPTKTIGTTDCWFDVQYV